MPRAPRALSSSGFYHVTLRGSGRQLLFDDDGDRRAFLDLLAAQMGKHGVEIFAWCLMDNHVHLLLRDGRSDLSNAMHGLATCYAQHFNRRSGHVGHVFQSRFGSEAIESDAHLLEVVRYIHDNPEKAGMSRRDEYRWSSYQEYAGGETPLSTAGSPGLTNTELVLNMLGGIDRFREFSMGQGAPYRHMRKRRVPDERAGEVARAALEGADPKIIASLPKESRGRMLRNLRSSGLSVRQIERLTGVGRWAITRATT